MKKLALILLMCFVATQHADAQNKKIYVSKQGGRPKLLYGFKMGYHQTHYTNNSVKCDTLICRGSGFERCFVDRNVFPPDATDETKYYDSFNFAIRKTEKHIKKHKSKDGVLTFAHKGQNISIKYKNADKKGNADMEIELL
jgi:hypothetical protein